MTKFTLLVSFLLGLSANANPEDSISLAVIFGDKTSSFEIKNEVVGHAYTFSTNDAGRKTGLLSTQSFAKLLEKVEVIQKQDSNDPKLCSRRFITLTAKNKAGEIQKSVGCIGSKTTIAKDLVELANALDQLL